MVLSLSTVPQWKYCMTFFGRPASSKILVICSATVGVCGDGLMMTVLPESRAGMMELTKIKYGYWNGVNLVVFQMY